MAGSTIGSQMPAGAEPGASGGQTGSVRFSVALPLRNEDELNRLLARIEDPNGPDFRKFITHDDFVRRFAPKAAAVAAVERELSGAGFQVSISDQGVNASGTQTQAERYFHTALQTVGSGTQTALGPRARLTLSPLLRGNSATVIGLDGIPPMHVFSKTVPLPGNAKPDNIEGPYGPYYAADLKQAYAYPSYLDATGEGVTIGIVIDSPVSVSDIDEYFLSEGSNVAPGIKDDKILGGGKYGGDGTGEATLDVEQSGGMAPRSSIVMFDIPSLSDTDIYDAYSTAVKDKSIVVVNSSFGG
jgi:subtilase family serine protease